MKSNLYCNFLKIRCNSGLEFAKSSKNHVLNFYRIKIKTYTENFKDITTEMVD